MMLKRQQQQRLRQLAQKQGAWVVHPNLRMLCNKCTWLSLQMPTLHNR
jgi:hypothetical protein